MDCDKFKTEAERIAENTQSTLGDLKALGIVSGTGWDKGIAHAFKERQTVPYSRLGIPGSEMEVEGHSKNFKIGEIDGRSALIFGRVHPNENVTDPNLRQAMALLIAALRPHLEGLIITNGVGTLHGPVGLENGWAHGTIRTAILDALGWAHRGRRKELIRVGDIALVNDVKTALVGPFTPLGAGDFVDFYHGGIHRDRDLYFDAVRQVISQVQGHCPRAQARFIAGSQFEGPADKIEFRAQGDDVIGMSGIQEMLACTKQGIPFEQIVLATNGPFGMHSHEGNQDTGKKNTEKATRIIQGIADQWPKR